MLTDTCIDSFSSNPTAYELLKLLLRYYPSREHLEMRDNNGATPLHIAAYSSNLTAIKIIYDHLTSRSIEIDVNVPDCKGYTPLDYSLHHLIWRKTQEGNFEVPEATLQSLQRRTAKTYEYLRNRGALFAWERQGITMRHVSRFTSQ